MARLKDALQGAGEEITDKNRIKIDRILQLSVLI